MLLRSVTTTYEERGTKKIILNCGSLNRKNLVLNLFQCHLVNAEKKIEDKLNAIIEAVKKKSKK